MSGRSPFGVSSVTSGKLFLSSSFIIISVLRSSTSFHCTLLEGARQTRRAAPLTVFLAALFPYPLSEITRRKSMYAVAKYTFTSINIHCFTLCKALNFTNVSRLQPRTCAYNTCLFLRVFSGYIFNSLLFII